MNDPVSKWTARVIVIFFCLTGAMSAVHAQISAHDMAEIMGRGINLGNTLSAPQEGNWAPPATEQFFIDLAAAGFTVARIPIRFDNQTQQEAPYEVNAAYLDRIDQVTGWALANDLVAIIDVHGDHWFWDSYDDGDPNTPTASTYARFMSIWTQISERFSGAPEKLLFEIMNEPYFSMSKEEVDQVNRDVLTIIRQTNPTRNVIITGGGVNSFNAPLQIDPEILSGDPYLIPTFHYYRPFSFTSSSRENSSDFQWGTEGDKQQVDQDFDKVLAWSQLYDVPVFLGEFGADNVEGLNYNTGEYGQYGGPDADSRIEYHRYLAQAAVSRGFPFAAWCAGPKSNKAIHLRSDNIQNAIPGVWVEEIRDALLEGLPLSTDQASPEMIELFPNPCSDYVVVKSSMRCQQLRIYDLSGNVLLSVQEPPEILDLGNFDSGFYLLMVSGEWGERVIPMIVQQ